MAKNLHPLNISFDEPIVQVNRRIFERMQELYNKNGWSREEHQEWTSLIHLVFHKHDKEADNGT